MSEPATIIGMRVADMAEAPTPSQKLECHECKEPIWISFATLKGARESGHEPIRFACAICLIAIAKND